MCGIAGLINTGSIPLDHLWSVRPTSIDSLCDGMLGLLIHRGPDEVGKLYFSAGFLGSTRLSIIDLHHGTQPISNETGDIWIVYNGEIYDVDDHISSLTKRGHTFRSRTDTEVIVHLYEEYGDEFLQKINGEFSFCLYDKLKSRTLLVRDPFGVRPLFYKSLGDGAFLFASEIKPILWACAETEPRISRSAVEHCLEGWTPIPPETCFEGIYQLIPGSLGVINAMGELKVQRYAQLPSKRMSQEDDLYPLLRSSVERRLKADVPVGIYLSGGLDSSIIAALAQEISRHELTTFSVEFDDAQFDESQDQFTMSAHIGSKHHSIRIRHKDILDEFVSSLVSAESIVFRSAFVPMFLLSRMVHETGLKVVLTGEGADELFGGYDLFREFLAMSQWAKTPSSTEIPQLLGRIYHYLPEFNGNNIRLIIPFYKRFLEYIDGAFGSHRIRWSNAAAGRSLLVSGLQGSLRGTPIDSIEASLLKSFPELAEMDIEEQCRQTEINTLLHGYLLSTQGDRMAAAHSVEVRLPFLDKEVVEFAYSHPVCSYIKDFQEKEILYSKFGPLLPQQLRNKKKTPYLAPDAEIFFENGGLGDKWRHYLGATAIEQTGIFDAIAVNNFLEKLEKLCATGKRLTRKDNTIFFVLLSSSVLKQEIGKNLHPRRIDHLIKKTVKLN